MTETFQNSLFAKKYRIASEIGQGGFAKVYKARDVSLERDVAIKILNPALMADAAFVKRFQQEAKAIARLNHPNITDVYEMGEFRGKYFLVMPLLPGPHLSQRLQKGVPMPPGEVYKVIRQIGSALDYAHGENLVHRDIKPANVLFDRHNNAILSDFGIARLLVESTRFTRAGTALGSPHYMAPELWKNEDIDGRADIYSLGIMLYQMLTGQLPFRGRSSAIMYGHLNTPPPSPLEYNPALPPQMQEVLEKALAKKPARRYQSAADLTRDMKQVYSLSGHYHTPPRVTPLPKTPTPALPPPVAAPKKQLPWMLWLGVGAIIALLVIGGILIAKTRGGAENPVPVTSISHTTANPPTNTPTPTAIPAPLTGAPPTIVLTSPPEAPPPLSLLSPSPNDNFTAEQNITFEWSGTLPRGMFYTIYLQGPKSGSFRTDTNSYRIEALPPGEYTWFVVVMDETGDFVTRSDEGRFLVIPVVDPPTVTPVPPRPPTNIPTPHTPQPLAPPVADTTLIDVNEAMPIAVFKWSYPGTPPPGYGFEVRVWYANETPQGVHDAVADNKNGKVQTLGNGQYQLTVGNIGNTPPVGGRTAEFHWAVYTVQIDPQYSDFGLQYKSNEGTLKYSPAGGGEPDGGNNSPPRGDGKDANRDK